MPTCSYAEGRINSSLVEDFTCTIAIEFSCRIVSREHSSKGSEAHGSGLSRTCSDTGPPPPWMDAEMAEDNDDDDVVVDLAYSTILALML
jgi:hypothetical protein